MSDEQPTSWRERFFGSTPRSDAAGTTHEQHASEPQITHDAAASDGAALAFDSVEERNDQVSAPHDRGPAVSGTDDTDIAVLDAQDADRTGDSPIEPTVIAPSALRGPSHSAAHPDDTARPTADQVQDEAEASALEQPAHESTPDTDVRKADSSRADAPAGTEHAGTEQSDTDHAGTEQLDTRQMGGEQAEPPALVEPRRPAFGLRRRADQHDADLAEAGAGDAPSAGAAVGASGAAAGAAAASSDPVHEFVEPEPTQAMEMQRPRDDDATQAIDAQTADALAAEDAGAQTRVLDAQDDAAQRTERFGIIGDEVPPSSIAVDDETALATARGGTPIVLVEEPMPPRRKGARGVGFAVALLATIVFGIVFAAAFFAVGYLFDREFNAAETLETLWLRPSYLLPVVLFFLAYLVVTLIVNRAGWWAHVLGAFIVALVVYAAHIAGAFMETQGGWVGYTELPGIDAQTLSPLLLAPLSVLAFVVAREVPVWVGGIVARRGRKAREWNRQAMDDFNAENAERLAAYERARG